MAEVKFNTTLEDKVNTVEFYNFTDDGIEENFLSGTKLFITKLDGTTVLNDSSEGIGDVTGHHFEATVDLSSVTENVNTDYDHPTYHHMYSLRSPTTATTTGKVYVYGKLNIVKIA